MNSEERPEHLVGGKYVTEGKEFVRDSRYLNTRIIKNGGRPDGGHDVATDTFPVMPGRYRLIAAKACPWANRTIIVRRLLGLDNVISLGMPGPTHDARSWTFDLDPGGLDPVLKIHWLQDAYFRRDPNYPRGITVPAMVDTTTGAVVTNDFAQITLDFETEWEDYHRDGAPVLLPTEPAQRAEMDALMKWIYTEINNGVYRCGFAGSQTAYEHAHNRLFEALDKLEERLATRRFLMGDYLTEADIRLFTTLARFDAVYYGHFKTNRNQLKDFPNLWGCARDLFQLPGIGETVDFDQIKKHYFIVQKDLNPTGIVPVGPDTSDWNTPAGREHLANGNPASPWGFTRSGAHVTPLLRWSIGNVDYYTAPTPQFH